MGFCLEVVDLFLAKCAANREKDWEFNLALLSHGIVNEYAALERISSMPVDEARKQKIRESILRLAFEVRTQSQNNEHHMTGSGPING